MQDGTLYCPVCGQEVQWVPDYSTLETLMQQHQIKKSIPDPEEIRRKQEQEEARRKAEEKKKKVHTTVLGFVICVLLLALIAFIINRKNYNSFDYQLAQAESELSNKNFDKALTYADRALSLNPDSVEANLLLAEIFTAQGDTGTALPILDSAVKSVCGSMRHWIKRKKSRHSWITARRKRFWRNTRLMSVRYQNSAMNPVPTKRN